MISSYLNAFMDFTEHIKHLDEWFYPHYDEINRIA